MAATPTRFQHRYIKLRPEPVARYTPHLWAYDFDKLADLFIQAGFSHIQSWPFDPTIANPERQWASVYIIATK